MLKDIVTDILQITNLAVGIAAPGAAQIVSIATGTIQKIADNHGKTYEETVALADEAEATFFKNNERRRQELLAKGTVEPQ